MREPTGARAPTYAAEDDTQKRYCHHRTDRRAAEGYPARPVAEDDEEGQRNAEQADQDRLPRRNPWRSWSLARKAAGTAIAAMS